MAVLRYISFSMALVLGIVLVVGALWYLVKHEPLFLIIQSHFISLDAKFLTFNLFLLILVFLAYRSLLLSSH